MSGTRFLPLKRLAGGWRAADCWVAAASVYLLTAPMALAKSDGATTSGNSNFTAAPQGGAGGIGSGGGRHSVAAPVPQTEGSSADMIMGIESNTIFFIAAAVFGLFWFTLGGGRKPKYRRQEK